MEGRYPLSGHLGLAGRSSGRPVGIRISGGACRDGC